MKYLAHQVARSMDKLVRHYVPDHDQDGTGALAVQQVYATLAVAEANHRVADALEHLATGQRPTSPTPAHFEEHDREEADR